MSVGAVAGSVVRVVLAAVLLGSAAAKVPATAEFASTIRRLGFASPAAGLLAPSVIVAELVAALGLLLSAESSWPLALVISLALAFAAAGLRALTLSEPVACTCFGGFGRSSRLGPRQVLALPVWLTLAALARFHRPPWSPEVSLQISAWLALVIAGCYLSGAKRVWPRIRGDRIAIRQSNL